MSFMVNCDFEKGLRINTFKVLFWESKKGTLCTLLIMLTIMDTPKLPRENSTLYEPIADLDLDI